MFQHNLAFAATMTGFGLGAGAIFSIGPQNLKLIQAGALRNHPATVAATGYLSEILIVTAGIYGCGAILKRVPSVELIMQMAGVAFLLWCAVKALAPGRSIGKQNWMKDAPETRYQAVTSMLATTWLNPLVYVEIMLLVGVLSSSYDGATRFWFALGFLAASCLRFCGLPTFGRALAPWLQSTQAQTTFNRIAGSLLLIVAASQAVAIV